MTQTDPQLLAALLALVEPTRRGDPESALCWTTLSTRKLAAELTAAGHRLGPDTVARLLHEQGFCLQGNAKPLRVSSIRTAAGSSAISTSRPASTWQPAIR